MEANLETNAAQTDIVIIGGGLAGLSAAFYLARSGVAVTLFEKSAGLGGRAATQVHHGYAFNRGIHAIYTGGATSQVLKELGIAYSGHSPKHIYALRQGKLHIAPIDTLTLLCTDLLSLPDKLDLMRVFALAPGLKPYELRGISVQYMPKLIWSHAIAAKSSVKPPRTALLRPNRWSIVFTYRKTLPKPWRSSFASRSVCSKRRPDAAQAKHILLPGRRCLRKLHRNVVLVIANE
jgi:putative NAD(P)-binding protein